MLRHCDFPLYLAEKFLGKFSEAQRTRSPYSETSPIRAVEINVRRLKGVSISGVIEV